MKRPCRKSRGWLFRIILNKDTAGAAWGRGPADTFTKRWQLCALLWKGGLELGTLPPDHIGHVLAPFAVEIVREELRGLGHVFDGEAEKRP